MRQASPELSGDSIRQRALACAQAALDKKAFDLRVLDIRDLTAMADYFVIASGRSDTQVRAIAEHVEETCRHSGARPLAIEGFGNGKWVLLDLGDVVVHVFYHPVREFYDLERLWSKAAPLALPESLERVRRANDGMASSEPSPG